LPEKESYRSPRKAFTPPAGVKEINRAKRRNNEPINTQKTNNKQQTTNNKQQTTNNKQQTTNNKQQTTNNPPTRPQIHAKKYPHDKKQKKCHSRQAPISAPDGFALICCLMTLPGQP
jgi:hypothetical protein